MKAYNQIQQKLQIFIRKYYTNELIKGGILFLAFGLLYFIFTLFVEYFLWLEPTARTALFWIFIGVEISLLIKYIVIPVLKLIGFSKGISLADASKIIGTHFKEIDDKLLNMLQLQESDKDSELVLASIDQKAKNLRPVPFQKAIQFSTNKKYLKYLAIPLLIFFIFYFSGKISVFSESYVRVVNHQQEYIPPAPFNFVIRNPDLRVIEGESIQLDIITQGDVAPEEAKIVFDEGDYFLSNQGLGVFSYKIENIKEPMRFYLVANPVYSKQYVITVIPVPKIEKIDLYLDYPKHVNKQNEIIENTGNTILPMGTRVSWRVKTNQTDTLKLSFDTGVALFKRNIENDKVYEITKNIYKSFIYTIQTSNKYLENYENLSFAIEVVPDEYPKMEIITDIDSISRGNAQFIGRLSDDYGLSELLLIYYDINDPEQKSTYSIDIQKSVLEEFYYIFPAKLNLIESVDYEFYFELFDNDLVTGPKSVKSKTYSYHKDTATEEQEKILEEQKQGLKDLENTLKKQEQNQIDLEKLKRELQNKPDIEYNDIRKLQQFIKRQEEYQQMMEHQSEFMQQNLEEKPSPKNEDLIEKKEDIKIRLEEMKELAKHDKLLDELKKMAEKLEKEDLLDKIKKMSKNNQQKQKSLEQLLELTKRFYVEKKAEQIKEKLEELAKKQEELPTSEKNSEEEQKKLNKEFENIQKDMEQLQKDNEALKEPMDIDSQKPEQQAVKEDQKQATEQLQLQNKQKAGAKQKSAAKKMKEMVGQMQMSMSGMQSNMIEEDIAMLRAIIENLITFSYKQEDLMNNLNDMHKHHPNFPKKLKEQYRLKTYFEHIDDSLYVLSMRQAKLSKHIDTYLANAHYYLDESLKHFEEFYITRVISDQRYIMTAANDLALLLSRLLDNMQSSMGMGGGGQGQGQSFSLPDIIKQQQGLSEKMKQNLGKGKKKGEGKEGEKGEKKKGEEGKEGESGGNGEQNSEALYEIYKQQAKLRQAIENQLNDLDGKGTMGQADKVKKQMEDLERLLLEKGVTNQVLEKMLQLEHELLKLKNAVQKQGRENKRESKTNYQTYPKISPEQVEFKNKYYQQNEILNREVLPLRTLYKKKVQEYFKNSE